MRRFALLLVEGWLLAIAETHAQEADSQRDAAKLPPIKIAMIGDSTMSSYANPPKEKPTLTGWEQVFGECFNERVTVLNHAQSGRSSKSFLREGRWEPVLREKPDFVFIQFGHNDQPGKGDRATDPNGDFQDNLRKYIDESRAAGATPILVTSVARRIFENGKAATTLTPYADAMKTVAAERKAPLVDLHAASFQLFDELRDAASADFSASASTSRTSGHARLRSSWPSSCKNESRRCEVILRTARNASNHLRAAPIRKRFFQTAS